MTTVDLLLAILDRRLTVDDIRALDDEDLAELTGSLYHWHELCEQEQSRRPKPGTP